MTSEGLGNMFVRDSADTCTGKFQLTSMGGREEGLACADQGARTPIGASENLLCILILTQLDEMRKTTLIFLKMEDDLIFFFKWKTTSILLEATEGDDFCYATLFQPN